MYLPIGGIEQWIQVGGDDPANPTLVYLHGGSSRPATEAWKPWERNFRVIHWDQRGTALTLQKHGEQALAGTLTIDRMVGDGIELAKYLRGQLATPIVLVGHSWGSVLGVHMVRRTPDLFAAYVGTGQLVNKRRNEEVNYARQLAQAELANDQPALDALLALGPPPFANRESIRTLRELADKLAPGTGDDVRPRPTPLPADFSAEDRDWLTRGFTFSTTQLGAELDAVDLPSLGLDFRIPMFFFEGTNDQQTPIELAEEYFSKIEAPRKAFVRFEGCHHFVMMNRPADFLAALVEHVLPVASMAWKPGGRK